MSKLDQLRALREAQASSRGSERQDRTHNSHHVGRRKAATVGAVAAPPTEPREAKPKRGRPRIEDRGKSVEARKPWVAAGMSRATWYARQAEKVKQS